MASRIAHVSVRLAVTGALLVVRVAPARADDAPNCMIDVRNPRCIRALDLHDEAQRLYAEGRYREALSRLDEAVASDPSGGQLFFNLGKIHELLGDLEPSIRSYRRALELEGNPLERERLGATVKRIEGALAKRELERPVPPPPPPPPKPAGPSTLRPWIWATGGTSIGAALIGGGLGIYAVATAPGQVAETGPEASFGALDSAAARAQATGIAADVLLGVAAASGIACLTLGVLAAESEGPHSPRVRTATLSLGAGSAALFWRFQ
jgi:tetratricopeptide (TPR) repeat protein